ncbi:MAG: type IX secretion system membrane protein PorP/SprF [Bacteroidetes bacterium]|nr:MAG: type IX secretion system membrane protein PorP/SprF [Bacteroidota bacterium]TAG94193.1 MAG: type IX secretion system membrane protein PorP/SprF [Bacteroidota bacterium]
MKKIIRKLIGTLGLVFLGTSIFAQDAVTLPVFSQFQYTPFMTDPAMLGTRKDLTIMFNYRRKNAVSGENFDTPMFSVVSPFRSKKTGKVWGSVGGSFVSDNSAGFLRTTGGFLGFAYNLNFKKSYLSFGAQLGYFMRSIDVAGLSTNVQYDGTILNPTYANGLLFGDERKGFMTAGAGVHWVEEDEKERQHFFLGASIMNFNQPNVDILNTNGAKLPASIQVTGGYRVIYTERFALMPTARYIKIGLEGNQQIINAGAWLRYHLLDIHHSKIIHEGHLGFGAWWDSNNTVIGALEFKQPNYLLCLSYDIPYSKDVTRFQRSGVFEISAFMKLRPQKPVVPEEIKDKDGDGVLDDNDGCPDVAGLKEFAGCPDKDGDGLPDTYDACPDEKGTKEMAGCPDTDGDGVTDKEDLCPTEAGTKMAKGCPDRDGDGIADKDDKCPDVQGVSSLQGCAPETVVKELTPMERNILENAKYIHFKTGTAVIEKTSLGLLDLVVEVIKAHENDVLDLDGHTDNVGTPAKNKDLGLQRAEAVKSYLLSKGAKIKIETESHGDAKPIVPNTTDDNKALNRRVEMKILKTGK